MPLSLTILYVLSTLFLLLVTVLMFFHNLKLYIKRTLGFFFFAVIGLLICMYFGYYFANTNHLYSLWFIRGTFAFAIILAHALVGLAYYYPVVTFKVPMWFRWVTRGLTLLAAIASFTNLIYEGELLTGTGIEDLHGELHSEYLFLYLFYIAMSITFFIKKFLSVKGIERNKTQLVALGGIGYALTLALVYPILPRFNIYIFQREAVLLGGILAILIFYSMMKYRFLDVRFTLNRVARNGASLLLSVLFTYGALGIFMLSPWSSFYFYKLPFLFIIAI